MNFESQCITELKEIKQIPTKSISKIDQRFKILLVYSCVTSIYMISFVTSKYKTKVEALELAMKLEASPIGDTSAYM